MIWLHKEDKDDYSLKEWEKRVNKKEVEQEGSGTEGVLEI